MGKIVLTAYISHGAPTSLVERTRIHNVYEKLGAALTELRVDTVVISSPHYLSQVNFEVESREDIPCIQDYYGFPDALYRFSYEAKNNGNAASEITRQSKEAGLNISGSQSWGLDHGAWLPLYFMFPKKDMKVVPVSIITGTAGEHFRFGQAVRRAIGRVEGTFAVIGTGSPVHRLDLIRYGYHGEDRFEPGEKFDEKLIETIAAGEPDRILNIQRDFPSLFHAARPEGNLSPLFTALGASDPAEFVGKTILHEFIYYGVSLVATILGAPRSARETFLSLGN